MKPPLHLLLHIPKTGGDCFKRNIEASLSRSKCLYDNFAFQELSISTKTKQIHYPAGGLEFQKMLQLMPLKQKEPIQFVCGHDLYYGVHEEFQRPAQYILFLRDPISRTLSIYNYERTRLDDFVHREKRLNELDQFIYHQLRKAFFIDGKVPSFEQWLEHSYDQKYPFYFTMTHCLQHLRFLESNITENAWNRCLGLFSYIGLTETIEEDSLYLFHKMGVRKFGANKNNSHPYIVLSSLEPKLKQYIEEKNSLDIELYRRAKEINTAFKKQCADFPQIVQNMQVLKRRSLPIEQAFRHTKNILRPTLLPIRNLIRVLLRKGPKKILLYLLLGTDKIGPLWYLQTKLRAHFSSKIKIGFGPISTGEDDLAVRKWRIDPIINAINAQNGPYIASFFLHPQEMGNFDIIVLVKRFNPEYIQIIQKLKSTRFIYDIVDNPNDEKKYRYFFLDHPEFIQRIDHFIYSSPVHATLLKRYPKPGLLIEHPIISPLYKTSYSDRSEIRLLAQGYHSNLLNLKWLEPLLPQLSSAIGKPIRLYYHSEVQLLDSEHVKYIQWDVANSFEMLLWADIAITIKDLFTLHQHAKPSTKVITYMAAGLPVICKPTPADQRVIQHRVTGFFAYTNQDWIRWITLLASKATLRKQIGRAARSSVHKQFTIKHILAKYNAILSTL